MLKYFPWFVVGATALIAWVIYWVASPTIGLMFAGIPTLVAIADWRRLKASDPPQIALVTIWGRKMRAVVGEGLWLAANYFPFFFNFIVIDNEAKNVDRTYADIPCNMHGTSRDIHDVPTDGNKLKYTFGGFVFADVDITYFVNKEDPAETAKFIDNGGHAGIQDQLDDIVSEILKYFGRLNTWEKMSVSNGEITEYLIHQLTGQHFDCHNEREVRELLVNMSRSPIADHHGLGIRFKKLNVSRIVPSKGVLAAAERVAIEEQERRSDAKDFTTGLTLVAKARKKFPNMSDQELAHYVQTDRGRAKRVIVDVSKGSSDTVAGLAALGVSLDSPQTKN